MLVFNSWLKENEMCVKAHKLSDTEAVQQIKDYTVENARGAVEFYLDANTKWSYHIIIEHHQTSFESAETFSTLVHNFFG